MSVSASASKRLSSFDECVVVVACASEKERLCVLSGRVLG